MTPSFRRSGAPGQSKQYTGKPLSEFIFVDPKDPKAVAQAEEDLRQTALTQPAVLATDAALTRLLAAYGIQPDMTMGHSLGEYGALVASGAADLYVHPVPYLKEWDTCAPDAMLRGAGGRVTDCSGAPLRYGKSDPAQPGGIFAA